MLEEVGDFRGEGRQKACLVGDPVWAKVRCGRRRRAIVPAGRQTAEILSGCDQRLFHQQRMAHAELVRCQGGRALSWEHWGAIEGVTAEG